MPSSELISVIVPIYKVEKYLNKCVDSILNQTYKNLEVILVDDGSPDQCGTICDEYAKKDQRVKVIHKENGGLSDARNAGMDLMMGTYVAFVDSDDWIEPDMYEKLLMSLHQFHADMAFGGVADELEQDGLVTRTKTSDYGKTPCAEDNISAMKRYFHGSWAAWDKLYKADLFEGIRYPVGEINEDEAIVLKLLNRCRLVCYTNEIFYHYMKREDGKSITNASFSRKKLDWQKHCAENLRYIQQKYPELEEDAATRYRNSLLWSLTEIAISSETFGNELQKMKRVLRENRKLFFGIPFKYSQDRIRMVVLTYLPFGVYKWLLQIKRR